jgi:Tol biopolymer transport system component
MAEDMEQGLAPEAGAEQAAPAEAAPEPKAAEAGAPLDAGRVFNFAAYWQQRSTSSKLQALLAWVALAGWLALAGGALWSWAWHPQPLVMGAGLLLLAIAYATAHGPALTRFGTGAERGEAVVRLASLGFLLAFATLFLVLALAHPARLDFRAVALAGVLSILLLAVLDYGLRLFYDWANARAGLWLLGGFALQVLALALFIHFDVFYAGLAAVAGLLLALAALQQGALSYLPSFSRLLVAVGLIINLPLFIFVLQEWGSPKLPTSGFECLDQSPRRQMDASAGELRWGPERKSEDGQPLGSSRISYSYEQQGREMTGVGIYLHTDAADPAEASKTLHLHAGREARGWSWSPDSSHLAFTCLGPKRDKARLMVFNLEQGTMARADGAQAETPTAVIMTKAEMICAGGVLPILNDQAWSPDSREFLFAAPIHGQAQVCRADLKRKSYTALTRGMEHLDPAWSPDGQELLYVGRADFPARYQIDLGHGWRDFSLAEHQPLFPAWSSDQRKVVFIKDGKLYRMASNGTGQEELKGGEIGVGSFISHTKQPLRFRWFKPADAWHLLVRPAKGGPEREIYTAQADRISAPLWSPDSKRVALLLSLDGETTVVTVEHDGSWPARLYASLAPVGAPAWCRDSSKVAFKVSNEEIGRDQLWVGRADGTEPGSVYNAQGELLQFTWSPNSSCIAIEEKTRFWPVFRDLYHIGVLNLNDGLSRQLMPYSLLSRDPQYSPNGTLLAFVGWKTRWIASNQTALWVARVE